MKKIGFSFFFFFCWLDNGMNIALVSMLDVGEEKMQRTLEFWWVGTELDRGSQWLNKEKIEELESYRRWEMGWGTLESRVPAVQNVWDYVGKHEIPRWKRRLFSYKELK